MSFRPLSCEHVTVAGSNRVKRGMAEMFKGGVIMDVVNVEQARIAEDAGAVAAMALERVPADIRAHGGAVVKATTFFHDPEEIAKASRGLGAAMVGINVDEIPQPHRIKRGW